jgi:hypothetical protein
MVDSKARFFCDSTFAKLSVEGNPILADARPVRPTIASLEANRLHREARLGVFAAARTDFSRLLYQTVSNAMSARGTAVAPEE